MIAERPAAAVVTEDLVSSEFDSDFLHPRRWTREEFYRLAECGFFEDERVELLDGEIWTLPAQNTPHFSAVEAAAEVLLIAFGESHTARRHGPITLDDGTEPEPDVVIAPGSWRDYVGHHPTPPEVRLLVEVSDATLAKDRNKKARDYSRAGIADYWIINLIDRQLEVYRDPAAFPNGHRYKSRQVLVDGDTIAPLSAPSSPVAVAALLPARQVQE